MSKHIRSTNIHEPAKDQRKAWTACFGHTMSEYFDYYTTLFATGEYLADQTFCEGLIASYDATKEQRHFQ